MELSTKGLVELASYEALILSPYLDSGGVKTVGIGSTKSDIPDLGEWSWSKEISIEEAVNLYKNGIQKYVSAVNRALTKLTIKQNQFDALVSFFFNVGTGGGTGSTAMKYVNTGRSDADVCKALKMWNKDNGHVVQGLINRRQKEADLYTNGIYNSGGMVDLVPVNPINHHPLYNKAKKIKLIDYL